MEKPDQKLGGHEGSLSLGEENQEKVSLLKG